MKVIVSNKTDQKKDFGVGEKCVVIEKGEKIEIDMNQEQISALSTDSDLGIYIKSRRIND